MVARWMNENMGWEDEGLVGWMDETWQHVEEQKSEVFNYKFLPFALEVVHFQGFLCKGKPLGKVHLWE
jgi:hypothetical protein